MALAISCISSALISCRRPFGAATGVVVVVVTIGTGARKSTSPESCGGLNADMRSSTSRNSNDVGFVDSFDVVPNNDGIIGRSNGSGFKKITKLIIIIIFKFKFFVRAYFWFVSGFHGQIH